MPGTWSRRRGLDVAHTGQNYYKTGRTGPISYTHRQSSMFYIYNYQKSHLVEIDLRCRSRDALVAERRPNGRTDAGRPLGPGITSRLSTACNPCAIALIRPGHSLSATTHARVQPRTPRLWSAKPGQGDRSSDFAILRIRPYGRPGLERQRQAPLRDSGRLGAAWGVGHCSCRSRFPCPRPPPPATRGLLLCLGRGPYGHRK